MLKKVAFFLTAVLLAVSLSVWAEPEQEQTDAYIVYEVQYILKKFGYFTGSCTGVNGELTRSALLSFQKDRGLPEDGTINADTYAAIRNANCTDATVTVRSLLHVRQEPDSQSEVIDNLTRNDTVYIYSQKDDWYHVETEYGASGFVPVQYLKAGTNVGIPGTVKCSGSVNVRKSASENAVVLFQLSADAEVWVIAGQGDWFCIDADGKIGYLFKKYMSIGGATTAATTLSELYSAPWNGTVTADHLKIRNGPGTGYAVITTLSQGSKLSVTGKAGEWYYVKMADGTVGYAGAAYIQKGSGASTCTVTSSQALHIRKGPGTSYDSIGSLQSGTVVYLLDDSASWYKIKTAEGLVGYIDSRYTKPGGSVASATATPASNVPSGTFKQGSQGNDVTKIQKRLGELGYLSASPTGYYGSATVNAVKSFQKNNGLKQDGVCNAETLKKLFSSSAKKAEKPSVTKAPSPTLQPGGGTAGSDTGKAIVEYAKTFLGRPYVYGANGPNSFDCTGFTCYVYNHFGIKLPRSAYDQGYNGGGTKITSVNDLKIGDLVFFDTKADNDISDHAGIYMGGGQFIHASSGSTYKVTISDLTKGYYQKHFSWGRHYV